MDGKRNAGMQVYDPAGATVGGERRIASSAGSMMKFMSVAVPALVSAGFGGGLAPLFGGGVGGAMAGSAITNGTMTAVQGGDLGDVLKSAGTAALTSGVTAGVGDYFNSPPVGNGAPASAPSFFDPGASFLGESVGAAPAWSQGIAGGLDPAAVGSGFLGGGSFMGESVAPAFSMPPSAPSFFDPGAQFLGQSVPQAQPMGTNPLEAWNPQPSAPIEASFTAPQAMPPVPQAPTSAPSFFDQGSSFLGEPVQPAQPMAQNPLTPWDVQPAAPIEASFTAPPSLPQATTFEELRAAEHADMGQGTGNIPKTVNMGELGGTTGTAGGLQGAYDVATQVGSDALSNVAGPAGDVASWMKANPQLGKLLMSGAMGLLSGSSAGSSGSAAPKVYGPAQQWSSPIQQGLLGNPQQMNPAAIQQRPQGLLAQGQQYDGAWRYMGGK